MATIDITEEALTVRFSTQEKLAGLRGDVRVPRDAVAEVEVAPDGLRATRGIRAPGLAIPGRRRIGTWRGRSGKEVVSVRRGQPAVRIRLHGQRVASLLIGLDEPASVLEKLR